MAIDLDHQEYAFYWHAKDTPLDAGKPMDSNCIPIGLHRSPCEGE